MCLQDCGHAPAQDDELFDQRQSPDTAVQATRRVVLAYDERMTLHMEDQGSSHPERPDRIRAVMARLTASGLAGCFPVLSSSSHLICSPCNHSCSLHRHIGKRYTLHTELVAVCMLQLSPDSAIDRHANQSLLVAIVLFRLHCEC